ncbi:uncharacterized protein BX664DRAFT_331395 [Halteromyces radiatus]|uniref:uncharacterized protein n=1 Tax=Halteromyces radiatus TaxID=101107 RepID=UPI00221FA972|nr:uncharacterized protein BX664DRAFT_331395 [Halteromyces radiatus]KAI8088796.1 hypothetical protein BX664DRAFT_331395 [Halteromyces radiatus]
MTIDFIFFLVVRPLFDLYADQHEEVTNAGHKAELSHELIAAAASYEAAKAYEEHCEREGKPDNHAKAKEILAGLTGFAVDRIVETKGLDYIDKAKAKHHAVRELSSQLENEYHQ